MDLSATAQQTLAVAEAAVATDGALHPLAWPMFQVDDMLYSIRVPGEAEDIQCPRCGIDLKAAGPTGFAAEAPICDVCLLEASPHLGMVLALVAVARAHAELPRATHAPGYWLALEELGAFVRIYDRFAAKAGPRRSLLRPDPRRSRRGTRSEDPEAGGL